MSNIRTGLPPQSQTWAVSQNQRLASAEDNVRILTGSVKDLQKRLQLQEQLLSQVASNWDGRYFFYKTESVSTFADGSGAYPETRCDFSFTIPEGYPSVEISILGGVTGGNNAASTVDIITTPVYYLGVGQETPLGKDVFTNSIAVGKGFGTLIASKSTLDVSSGQSFRFGFISHSIGAGLITNVTTHLRLDLSFKREEL